MEHEFCVCLQVRFKEENFKQISKACAEAKRAFLSFDVLKGADVDDDLFKKTMQGWKRLVGTFTSFFNQVLFATSLSRLEFHSIRGV